MIANNKEGIFLSMKQTSKFGQNTFSLPKGSCHPKTKADARKISDLKVHFVQDDTNAGNTWIG